VIALARWPLALLAPAMKVAAFLADAGFVLEKQADTLGNVCLTEGI
jgi:hypothetical protein